jgi:polyferredoxin
LLLKNQLPAWSVKLMQRLRNVIVFAAIFIAFFTLRPALSSYEPFAVLFSLRGTTLQWLLLFMVLVTALTVRVPWCSFLCPMRTIEGVLLDLRRAVRRRKAVTGA